MTTKFDLTGITLLVVGVLLLVLTSVATVVGSDSAANAVSPVPQHALAATDTVGGLNGLSAMGGGGNR